MLEHSRKTGLSVFVVAITEHSISRAGAQQFSRTIYFQSTFHTCARSTIITGLVSVSFLLQLPFLPSGPSTFCLLHCSWLSASSLPSWLDSTPTSIQQRLKLSLTTMRRKRTQKTHTANWILSHRHRCECQQASGGWTGPRTCPDFCPQGQDTVGWPLMGKTPEL